MRPYLALSLLFLCLLLSHEAQGIRLDKMFMSLGLVQQQKQHEADGNGLITKSILCKDGHCSSGKNRKLIITATSTTTTTTTKSKNEKNIEENKADHPTSKGKSGNGELGDQEENFRVEHHEIAAHEQFPADMIDIAEMDYSPAKRKPPIHN